MDAAALKKLVIDSLEDLKAQDITVLDVTGRTSVTDTMIIATGTSSRHAQALAENVSEKAKAAGEMPLGSEGRGDSDWVLIDLGDVVVHVMTAQSREYYDLESLWSGAEATD
ncbi:MAG: ribosome silencing factor [Bermanella sp.]